MTEVNKKFYNLSEEKQNNIKNAGYNVFGDNVYKKASMQLIADEAGISKSLLFHYFRNKQTLYEWLFVEATRAIDTGMTSELEVDSDFFQIVEETIVRRLAKMVEHGVQFKFFMRVYDEASKSGHEGVREGMDALALARKKAVLAYVDRSKFIDGMVIGSLYDMVIDISVGFYERHKYEVWDEHSLALAEFRGYMKSLKKHYYKEVSDD